MADIRPLIGLGGVVLATMTVDLNLGVSATALPDVAGGLGLSHDPGTWFSSLYISGESCGMLVAPWFLVTLTLRRFMLGVIALCCTASLLIPETTNLALLYALRVLQGLSSGLTVPLLMATALRVLGPPIRLFGLAAYALTATCFPYVAPALAALWTGGVGWQFVFWQALPFCALAAVLVWYGLPQDEPQYQRFRVFNWRGLLLGWSGLFSLTTLLQQGTRFDWFNSNAICLLGLISLATLPALVVNEWFHELPFVKLQLLGRRNLLYGVLVLFLFIIISNSANALPLRYLMEVQGYRPTQAYPLTVVIALSQLVMLPGLALFLNIKWVDARVVSFVGLALVLAACLGASLLNPAWNRGEFWIWQILQAIGQPMVVMPLLLISTNAVVPKEGPFVSALFNAPRSIAEALGTWLVDIVMHWRGDYHSMQIVDQLGRRRFELLQAPGVVPRVPPTFSASGMPSSRSSLPDLMHSAMTQTTVLALSDAFTIIAGIVVSVMVILLVLPLRTYPPQIVFAEH